MWLQLDVRKVIITFLIIFSIFVTHTYANRIKYILLIVYVLALSIYIHT